MCVCACAGAAAMKRAIVILPCPKKCKAAGCHVTLVSYLTSPCVANEFQGIQGLSPSQSKGRMSRSPPKIGGHRRYSRYSSTQSHLLLASSPPQHYSLSARSPSFVCMLSGAAVPWGTRPCADEWRRERAREKKSLSIHAWRREGDGVLASRGWWNRLRRRLSRSAFFCAPFACDGAI